MIKKTLFFDGRNLIYGLRNDSMRSGIYYVSINLLKVFLNSPYFDVTVYCEFENITKLKLFLDKETSTNVNMFSSYSFRKTPYQKFPALKEKSKQYRSERKWVRRIFLDILCKIIKLTKPWPVFNEIYDIYFSPQLAFMPSVKAKKHSLILYDTIQIILPQKGLLSVLEE